MIKKYVSFRTISYCLFILGSGIAVATGSIHGTEAVLLLSLSAIAILSLVTKTCIGSGSCAINEVDLPEQLSKNKHQ